MHTQSRKSKIMNLAGARRDPKDPLSRALHDQTRESISEEEVNPKPSSNPKSISLRDTFPPGRNDVRRVVALLVKAEIAPTSPNFCSDTINTPWHLLFFCMEGMVIPAFLPDADETPVQGHFYLSYSMNLWLKMGNFWIWFDPNWSWLCGTSSVVQNRKFLNMAWSKLILALWNQHLNFTVNRENCLLW